MGLVWQEQISGDWLLRLEAPGSIAAALDPPRDALAHSALLGGSSPGILVLARGSGSLPSDLSGLLALARDSGAPLRFVADDDGALRADTDGARFLDRLRLYALEAFGRGAESAAAAPEAQRSEADLSGPAAEPGSGRWVLGQARRRPENAAALAEPRESGPRVAFAFRAFSISLWRAERLQGPAASGFALRLVQRAWARMGSGTASFRP